MQVFYTSPWIPAEWIKAHGLEPRGIWGAKNLRLEELPASAGVCAFAEAVVRQTAAQRKSAAVFASTCDQLRRGFDSLPAASRSPAFLFNLPATWQSPAARELYRSEVERLGRFLQELGGSAPSPDTLQRELAQRGEARAWLREAAPGCSARRFTEAVAQYHWDGSFHLPPDAARPPANGVPLALVGGPLIAPHSNLFAIIEAAGGRVVLNGTETGERSLCPACALEPPAPDPFDAMVRGYFENIVDVFQRPNTRFYSWLKERLAARQVRGMVLWHFTGCDLWRAEGQTLRETFGLPVLLLEAGETSSGSPRDAGRLQAFVEMLR